MESPPKKHPTVAFCKCRMLCKVIITNVYDIGLCKWIKGAYCDIYTTFLPFQVHRKTTVEDFEHRFCGIQVSMITGSRVVVMQRYEPQPPQGQYPPQGMTYQPQSQFSTNTGYPGTQQSAIPLPSVPSAPNDPTSQPGYGYDQPSDLPPAYPGPPQNAI